MTMRVFFGAVASVLAIATLGCSAGDIGSSGQLGEEGQSDKKEDKHPFVVESPNFEDGDALPAEFTCQNNAFQSGVTPELNWTKGPQGTKSYAIVLHDVSLSDPNFAYHWAAWNIPHEVRTLPQGIPGLDPANPTASNPFPDGLKGGQQVQARNVSRYFAPCPMWIVRKADKCNWPEPRPTATSDSYTFTIYALPDKELTVPAYDATVDPNYAHQLDAIFAARALGSTQISFTSNAVPGSIPDNGPFNCSNPPQP
jgi:phosphatidylethanolamine-binding protein (PEBP) family uncharacterized protein